MQPFRFGTVFWGETFRHFFLDYCLASLLAPGNIPAIVNKAESRFLICTTQDDWQALRSHPNITLLERHIAIELIPFTSPRESEAKMAAMSRGHRAIADAMHAAKCWGSIIYPDTIYSSNTIALAQRAASAGRRAVLVHCPRFANENFVRALEAQGVSRPGEPLVLSGPDLVRAALRHMHSETLTYEWDAPHFFPHAPPAIFWRDPPGTALLFQTFCWAPVLLDFSSLPNHDPSTLEQWTIDGDYVHRNFPNRRDIEVVTDSDDAVLLSFTPESMLTYFPLQTHRLYRVPLIGELFKRVCLRAFLHSPAIDPLKRSLFAEPVKMHTSAPVEWAPLIARGSAVARQALATPRRGERQLLLGLRALDEGPLRHIRAWFEHRLKRQR